VDGPLAVSPPASRVWVELAAPGLEERVEGPIALAEIRGRAGQGSRTPLDIVLAVDTSLSTLYPSGRDVDGDGITGKLRGPGMRFGGSYRSLERWTTDPGDTVLAAELEAARRLLEHLEVERTRVGLMTFALRPRVRAELDRLDRTTAVLGGVRPRMEQGGTDLGAAVRAAVRMLTDDARDPAARSPILLLLSDGEPTFPSPELYARREALRAAERARDAGVRIFAFAVGADPDGASLLAGMAEVTGGEVMDASNAGDLLEQLPVARLAGIESIEIENLTSAAPARAVRLFADGSFDGFVPLEAGTNRIEVRVRTLHGECAQLQREITFSPRAASSEADLQALAELNERLSLHALESELAQRSRERMRRIRIQVPASVELSDELPAAQPAAKD
jgi:uncharacterized protein YegL